MKTLLFISILLLAGCAHQERPTEDYEARGDITQLKDRMDRIEHDWSHLNREPVLQDVNKKLQAAQDELTQAKLEYWAEKEKVDSLKRQEKELRKRAGRD